MSNIYLAQQQKWLDDYHRSARGAIAGLIAGCGIYLIGVYSNTPLIRSTCSLLTTISAYSVMQVRWIARSNQAVLEASRDISAQAILDDLFLGTRPENGMSQSAQSVNGITILPLSPTRDN
ncbi:MAG: hypothetical protein DSM106950_00530 [Stigonema ocellatum SAG 48.90 = DSM 106950]|nr:hypothetical protein [Stigonema ocellatum SAG 48.90 = DSM 106950]